MVGIIADLGGQVEGHAQAGLAFLEQIEIPLVGLFRRGEPGVLAHGPEASAVHGRLDAAGKRVLAREAQRLKVIERGQVLRGVELVDGRAVTQLELVLPLGEKQENGKYDLVDAKHFFESFAKHLGMNFNVTLVNDPLTVAIDWHKFLEPVFKALGIALDIATQIDPRRKGIPSTKGVID